ncbi:hypothetical protein KY284_010979 [Solanum tuberosum]|nr:hypothetical protein KY284_010979 [Solanum tuberosum]
MVVCSRLSRRFGDMIWEVFGLGFRSEKMENGAGLGCLKVYGMVMHFQICPWRKKKTIWVRMVILLVGLELAGCSGGYGEKNGKWSWGL